MFFRRVIRYVRYYANVTRGFLKAIPENLAAQKTRLDELTERLKAIDEASQKTGKFVLFQTIGRALTAWARLEEVIIVLTSMLLRIEDRKAGLVMYSIINFSTWLQIVGDLFELDEEFRPFAKRWNKISERIRKIKDRRDQLAHQSVRDFADKLSP